MSWLILDSRGRIADGTGTRTTATVTTASIANEAEATGIITIGKSFIINKSIVDRAARVRLYASAAFRTADADRPIGIDPTGESGLLMEIVHTTSFLDFSLAPPARGYNDDSPVTDTIYYAIQNRSGSTHSVELLLDITVLVP